MAGRVAEAVMEQEIKNEMKQRILAELDMSQEIDDMEVRRLVDQCIMEYKGMTELPLPARIKLRKELFIAVAKKETISTSNNAIRSDATKPLESRESN